MSKTVVVDQEAFETLATAIQDEDGWTVDESTITDPDGTVAVQTSSSAEVSEQGSGMAEWLLGTALVAFGVVSAFLLFAPRFIEAFNAQISAALP